jgi:hypothetical protein
MDDAKRRFGTVLAAALCFVGPSAYANDSVAALTTGGLVFKTSADIEMRS